MSATTSTVSITAITLSQTDLEKIEVLDRSKNNWNMWSDKLQNYLLLKHGGGYILGIIPRPDSSVDPTGASIWGLNNLCIIAALCTCSSTKEQDFLHMYTNAHLAWSALKSCHEKVGPIVQIILIQQGLAVKYKHAERVSTTSMHLSDLVGRIYVIGLPKEEDFLMILMLNAMSEELPHVHNHIADSLATSMSSAPYGSSNICACLDVEQQLIDSEKSFDIAMVTTKGKAGRTTARTCTECGHPSRTTCCTNCRKWWHAAKDCFGKGRAMEGKKDEVTANKSLEAVYIAGAAPSPSKSLTPTKEFAGLAYDEVSLAFIHELPDSDCDEYNALFAALRSLSTSVDWCSHTQPVDFAGLTYKASNQCARTLVDPSILPFFLDSGASIHISNTGSDFYSLHPIPPCSVSSVGGSLVQAVAIETICLIVASANYKFWRPLNQYHYHGVFFPCNFCGQG
ncbi:hypothetical protein BDR06DRAFT_967884 [Suillus hirtellus]|nr:hypothetical protein BDR06DRAFT_967884 [Suillus hirtellus]